MELQSFCEEYQGLHASHPDPGSVEKVAFYAAHRDGIKDHAHPKPVLSIAVPARNEQVMLPRPLASVDQACTILPKDVGVEVVVVDNNSSDATGEIAQEFRVNLVKENKKGIAVARDTGLRATKQSSEVVLTTDCDTVVQDFWIYKYLTLFLNNPNIVMAFGNTIPIIDDEIDWKQAASYHIYRFCEAPYRWLRKFERYAVPASNNLGFRREAAVRVGGYDKSLARGEDYELYTKLRDIGEVRRMDNLDVLVSGRRIYKDPKLLEKIANGVKQMGQFCFKHEGMTGYYYQDYRTDNLSVNAK